MDEVKKPFFETENSFISWISAYYPAPHGFVKTNEERMKNAESWERFFAGIRTASGIRI